MPRRVPTVALTLGLTLGLTLAACEEHTVTIRFEPDVGDVLRYHSTVRQSVRTELDGVTTDAVDDSVLETTQRITGVEGDDVRASVTVVRDGSAPRTFDARVDRASRLAGIDLIEGVPAVALGIDVTADVPSDLYRPPTGPVEAGTRWMIRRAISLEGVDDPVEAVGFGRITGFDLVDGTEVAVAVVELRLPVRTVVESSDGRLTLIGVQYARSETAYDLADGALYHDQTTVRGDVDVVVEPPPGLEAAPARGRIDYTVTTTTTSLDD